MKRTSLIQFLSLLSAVYLFVSSCITSDQVKVTGEMKVWHTITFTFTGPESSEFDTINLFTDYRLDVGFTNGKQEIYVPGYFAADGNAAESSARSANKWRVHFCPPADGTWSYKVTFLKGKDIAISDDLSTGQKCYMDGDSGTFKVDKTDKSDPDFRAKGRIQYDGTRYLKHAGNGEIFLQGGSARP